MSIYAWARKPIKNILLDINGVLYDSGMDFAIEGSLEAMKRLVDYGYNFCLVTNECTTAKRLLAKKLNNFGFDCISPNKIVSPGPVACRYLIENKLKPRLHIWHGIEEDFEPVIEQCKSSSERVNCLVVGDVMNNVSRDYMDESLEIMLNCQDKPQIVSLGAGRYYKDSGRFRMDTGAYVAAFEYALGVKSINLAKPSRAFFMDALNLVEGSVEDTIMIGDDVISDVGGAQSLGMRGFLVRTGKYKPSDETGERGVNADHVFNNLNEAIEVIIRETSL